MIIVIVFIYLKRAWCFSFPFTLTTAESAVHSSYWKWKLFRINLFLLIALRFSSQSFSLGLIFLILDWSCCRKEVWNSKLCHLLLYQLKFFFVFFSTSLFSFHVWSGKLLWGFHGCILEQTNKNKNGALSRKLKQKNYIYFPNSLICFLFKQERQTLLC